MATQAATTAVYFDTNFYINLATADNALAAQVIDELNSLGVAYVFSELIARELLKCTSKPEADKRLVARLDAFENDPIIFGNLPPNALLTTGEERTQLAEQIRKTESQFAEAEAVAISANRSPTLDSTKEVLKNHHSEYMDITPEEIDSSDPNDLAVRMAEPLFQYLAPNQIPDELVEAYQELRDGNAERCAEIAQECMKRLARENPKEYASKQLSVDVTKHDDRPERIATNRASDNEERSFSHDIRDAEHLSYFLENPKKIDFFQTDKPTQNRLDNDSPNTPVHQHGLVDRIFAASDLQSVVNSIRDLTRD